LLIGSNLAARTKGQELAAVAELIDSGGVLVVEGGAGIGKTSLLRGRSEMRASSPMSTRRFSRRARG
jgi:ABC-type transport system involved in cytochrome c biogenesis ATPase subunit